ncbi:methyltransferase [Clostridium tetani]|uniref:class I SAM-dependent methyltransferase n=1 Tax=Clostridium tetani TaxID=1513 RepID=UPI000D20B156|nr:class I SAM-dependent methyltransferase [Clostridium tetani]AVP54232.1 hypothetical protein C3B72_03505 [Clostridium tetani]RXI76243.1 hypothetical protein DP128_06885 [Clostridium tetani]WFN61036.1 class I SAM-dependent methyltransferase [Clostridium tetani]SUY56262.1 methyltransferase [Clostridium tetani]BDR64690.1 methyltransferase [Clostridium tetani]
MKKISFNKNNECRLCKSKSLLKFIEFKDIPLAGNPVSQNSKTYTYNLDAYVCEECSLVQLIDVIDSEIYEEYTYTPSHSEEFKLYVDGLAEEIHKFFGRRKVIEIGSGNGYFLKCIKDRGSKVLGFEPSRKLASESESMGIDTVNDYFCSGAISKIPKEFLKSDMIIMRHVLEHIDSFEDIMGSIRKILDNEKGILLIEVPYLGNIINENQFYAFFHEHLSYYSLSTITKLLNKYKFKIIGGKKAFMEGGSMLVYAIPEEANIHDYENILNDGEYDINKNFINDDKLSDIKTLQDFANNVKENIQSLNNFILSEKNKGKKVAAWGAGQRGISLINLCGLNNNDLEYLVDVNPLYDGLYVPIANIPIVKPDYIYEKPVDYIVVFATGYIEFIRNSNKKFEENGGHFVSIIPKVSIYKGVD